MFSTCESQTGVCCDPADTSLWNTKVAAEMYGKSERTIRRLAKDGVIEGYKVEGTFGPEWRIKPDAKLLQGTESRPGDCFDRFEVNTKSVELRTNNAKSESFYDKEIIAQLQTRIAEMEQALQAQKRFEEQKSILQKNYSVSEITENLTESESENAVSSNTVLLFWQSVRGILGRYCSYFVPRSNRNEVA